MKAHIRLLKIPIHDISRAVEFYETTLGWTLEFAVAEYGWAQFQIGELSLALYQPGMGGGNRAPGGSVDFHLAVDDLVALQLRLKAHRPELEAEIQTNEDETLSLEFQDPDGNEWKIFQLD